MALYIVGTPIGNLSDITIRALDTLRSVDQIVAEDTRVTKKLLHHYGIQKPVTSFHAKSSVSIIHKIGKSLEQGKDIAYVVDAGTPGISDPGAYLVKLIRETYPHVVIIPIPGPSALASALSIAGLSRDEFLFLGFPPHKKGRKKFFESVALAEYAVVLYESPHRIKKTLSDLVNVNLGDAQAHILKELTKMYESYAKGKVVDLQSIFDAEASVKGEYVLIIEK